MRIKKALTALIVIALFAMGLIGNNLMAEASNASIVLSEDASLVIKPGETTHIKLPIKAVGGYIANPQIALKAGDNVPFTLSQPKLTAYDMEVMGISSDSTTYVEFDVTVNDTAKIGYYPVTLEATYEGYNENLEYGKTTLNLKFNLQILEEKAPAQLTISEVNGKNPVAGSDTELSFKINNEGEITAHNIYIKLDYKDTGIVNRYTAEDIRIGDLAPGKEYLVTLPVSILPSAKIGSISIPVNFQYKNIDGTEKTDSYSISLDVRENEEAPSLDIESVTSKGELWPGDEFTLVATLHNYGGSKAENIKVTIDPSSIGSDKFIKNYFTDEIEVANIAEDGKREAKIPMIVSKDAQGGVTELKINISYTNELGMTFTSTKSIFLDILKQPNIIISSVKQNPAQPKAGDNLELSFDMENKSQYDVTDVRIYLSNISDTTFIPVNPEPYLYLEKLEGGTKKRITIPLIVSDNIKEGLNKLTINYTYSGNSTGETVDIPVLDVQNDLGSSSKPKLIVSNYTTDMEKVKAGSTFNFIFDIHNTHSSVAAKNITITVTQKDNVFAPTQGGNSFFINKIGAGETVSNTIELKVKSDASTGTYPIDIKIDYEFDGAEPNPETGEIGVTKTETLNIQAVENYRPVVDYVNVYAWDGPVTIGTPAILSFEFYNMGKSTLNNVTAIVSGDFAKADGNMYYVGNVQAGSRIYEEFEVIPNLEGQAKGTLTINFEDSNGEQLTITQDFETNVISNAPVDEGGMSGDGSVDVFMPEIPEPKKPIMPLWLFIIIEVAVFIIFIPITRKVIISIYKVRLRRKEEEQY